MPRKSKYQDRFRAVAKPGHRVQMHVRLPLEVRQALRQKALAMNVTVQDLLEDAVYDFLRNGRSGGAK